VQELYLCGIDKTVFDVNDFINALEKSTLQKLFINPYEFTPGKSKGLQIDKLLEEKLKKVVDTNGHLSIHGVNEVGKAIIIQP